MPTGKKIEKPKIKFIKLDNDENMNNILKLHTSLIQIIDLLNADCQFDLSKSRLCKHCGRDYLENINEKGSKVMKDIIKRFDDGLRKDENISVTDKYGDGWEFNGEYSCDDLIDYCHNFIDQAIQSERESFINFIMKKLYNEDNCNEINKFFNEIKD